MSERFDLAVVGAGIAGLAHAWHAARRGLKVAVFERGARAQGASIRNFGLIWPIGQPAGAKLERALRARGHWKALAAAAGFDLRPSGALHLAYHADECAVLEEFAAEQAAPEHGCRMITAPQACGHSTAIEPFGLKAALWSEGDCTVTSPQAIAAIAAWLEREQGVRFFWRHAVAAVEEGQLVAGGRRFGFGRIAICCGADLETLFPQQLQTAGLKKCKLHMWSGRMPDAGFVLGPALCAGLTLLHYDAFAACRSLPQLQARIERELPDTRQHGVHILVSQHASGELILGDSHHYGDDPEPFDHEAVYAIMQRELARFTRLPGLQVTRRWHGVYPKLPGATEWMAEPLPGVHLVTGLGGTGMTLTLGLAEENISGWFG